MFEMVQTWGGKTELKSWILLVDLKSNDKGDGQVVWFNLLDQIELHIKNINYYCIIPLSFH